jgi:hypothetical protein
MTSQPPDIPWDLLVSNLHWVDPKDCKHGISNLHVCGKPGQGISLNSFAVELAESIWEQTILDFEKYAAISEPPHPDDIVLDDDELVIRLSQIINFAEVRTRYKIPVKENTQPAHPGGICRHRHDMDCFCRIPSKFRRVSAFRQDPIFLDLINDPETYAEAIFALEIFMALVIHGELKPIFRMCLNGYKDDTALWACPSPTENVSFLFLSASNADFLMSRNL